MTTKRGTSRRGFLAAGVSAAIVPSAFTATPVSSVPAASISRLPVEGLCDVDLAAEMERVYLASFEAGLKARYRHLYDLAHHPRGYFGDLKAHVS